MTDKSIQKALEQDAQIVTERMPIDMTKQQAKKIAEKLKTFMAERKLSQSKTAKNLGVSSTLLNQFLNGKYKGNLEDIVNRAVNYMNSMTRRESRVKNKPFIETSVAKKIGAIIKQTDAFSDEEGKIGVIVGDGGHGKSHCLRYYAEANKNTVYVEIDRGMNSTMIFSEIAKKIGGIDASGSLANVTRRLIDAIHGRNIIIMLDEASSLNVNQLDLLRQIVVVKSRCPLILAGNQDLLKTIRQPTTRRGFESLDQFTSRLMCILNLDEAASSKDGGLYTADDIRKLYEFGGIKLMPDGVKTLRQICRTPRSGRLRTCSHVIAALLVSRPYFEAKQKQTYLEVGTELIVAAIHQLDLPVRVRLPIATFDTDEETEQPQSMAKAG